MTTAPASSSRRDLLRFGLLGGAALATVGLTASLTGCSADAPAAGFSQLRDGDLPLLRRLIPVILDGAVPTPAPPEAVAATLAGIDRTIAHLSPALATQVLQLFDLLTLPVTRGPLTGIWGGWASASDEQVRAFLERWEGSRLMLLRQGYRSLLQLTLMSWYSQPRAWAACGYPGPPTV